MKKLVLLSFIVSLIFSSLPLAAQFGKKAQFQTLFQMKMEKAEKEYKVMAQQNQLNYNAIQGNPLNSEDYFWVDEDWLHTTNTAFTYNEMGHLTEQLITDAVTGDLIYKVNFEYDSQQNQIKFIYSEWVNGDWVIVFGFSSANTYDESGLITEQISQFYNNESMLWENSYKYIAYYDNDQNLVEEIFQYWTGAEWSNDFRQVYTVDEQGIWTSVTGYLGNGAEWMNYFRIIDWVWHDWANWIESSATYQYWEAGMWVDSQRFSTEFNDNGYVRTFESNENGDWVLVSRSSYTVTAPEHVYLYENYISGAWVNIERDTEFYDDYQNFAGFRFELWQESKESVSGTWIIVYYFSQINTYDENGDITEVVYQFWDDQVQMLVNSDRHVFSNFITGISVNGPAVDLNIFPNPVESVLEISSAGGVPEHTRFRLLDISGKVLQEGQLLKGKNSLDVSRLGTGMYFLNVNTRDNQHSSFKVLKK